MEMPAAVKDRLTMLGYTPKEQDTVAISYNINKAENKLKALTNQNKLPEGLQSVWVDMAAGYFLTDKKASGALADIYNFSAPAKSISEGDTSVTFAIADTGSAEDQFDAMLVKLVTPDDDIIVRYRRLLW